MPRTKKTTTEETTEAKVDFTVAKKVKIWFFTELLGSLPKDPEIYVKYIASKALDAPSVQEMNFQCFHRMKSLRKELQYSW